MDVLTRRSGENMAPSTEYGPEHIPKCTFLSHIQLLIWEILLTPAWNSVITTPEDLRHFSSDANEHPKTPNVNLGWFVGELLGRAMGLLYGPDWKRLRKIFDPAFTHSAALARIDVVNHAARKYVEALALMAAHNASKTCAAEKADGSVLSLPVLGTFTKFPYFLTASTIYGPMTEEEERDLWSVTEKRIALNQYWIAGGPYRFEKIAKLYDSGTVQHLKEFNEEWRDYNSRMVEVRQARGEKTPITTYWDEYQRGNMTMDEVRLYFLLLYGLLDRGTT